MAARRTRVLMLLDELSPRSGGAERVAVALAAHLPAERFEVALCATRRVEPPWPERLRGDGVRWFALGRRGTADVLPLGRLARLLRSQRVDVLHSHMFGSNLWGSLVGRAAGVPAVVAHEHTWDYDRRLRRMLDGYVIGRLAGAFVATSTADRDRMVELEHVPAGKVVVLPNARLPRTPAAPPQPTGLRAQLGLPRGAPLLGTAAMLRPQKALPVLVEALARSRHRDAQLVIAGDGPCRDRIADTARRCGVAERVHLLGLRDDVDGLLAELDVAAMSSDFEGSPLFALECQAAGVPLVATAVGGVPDIVAEGETGLLVPRRDPAALAAALDALLDDPAGRERMGAAARDRAAAFTVETLAGRCGELYERLLRDGAP